MENLRIGTCSWNYDSWVGLVYSGASPTAAGYLGEYSKRFRTAEVDSWFYKMPESREVLSYLGEVDEDFTFSCKVSEEICLTHKRNRGGSKELVANPGFLSKELFLKYVGRIEPMRGSVEAVMLEFEYLNKDKMPSLDVFLRKLDDFCASLPEGLAASLPLAVEVRNKNYLVKEYFQFLRDRGLVHVFSEKQYLPHIYDLYSEFGDFVGDRVVMRLLGGDRKAIEEKTGERWDRIVEERDDKERIAEMTRNILYRGGRVVININNHFEGSAPLTAAFFEAALA
jgi:uncharacterized protein YecE (DUF72 family)